MSYTPYKDLPAHCFWRKANAVSDVGDIDPVISAKFQIEKRDRISTAGSCFAQHLALHLQASGYHYFIAEKAHPIVSRAANDFNYGTFSGRYGNIYTAAQLRQLFDRAYGKFQPEDDIWLGEDGHFYDPFRPAIQPGGFATQQEFMVDRAQHFAAFRRIIKQSDVFIFTLGLTEAWQSRTDGAVYPLCPGVAAGTFDPEQHEFVNFRVQDVVRDMGHFMRGARKINPGLKFILTVSPVPLIATAVDRSVIQSTIYSKSVLRVAAEILSEDVEHVAYFPSYEIITGPSARGQYFEDDCREVRPEGVAHVMRLFMTHYAGVADPREARVVAKRARVATDDSISDMEDRMNVVCDEEIIAAHAASKS